MISNDLKINDLSPECLALAANAHVNKHGAKGKAGFKQSQAETSDTESCNQGMNEKELETLAQKLSTEFKATVKLDSARTGTVKMDMLLGDLTRLEYLKELSDKSVLSNIVDRILITPDFVESCLAEDVAIDVVVEEETYQKARLQACK